jgi:hypothetical protein
MAHFCQVDVNSDGALNMAHYMVFDASLRHKLHKSEGANSHAAPLALIDRFRAACRNPR